MPVSVAPKTHQGEASTGTTCLLQGNELILLDDLAQSPYEHVRHESLSNTLTKTPVPGLMKVLRSSAVPKFDESIFAFVRTSAGGVGVDLPDHLRLEMLIGAVKRAIEDLPSTTEAVSLLGSLIVGDATQTLTLEKTRPALEDDFLPDGMESIEFPITVAYRPEPSFRFAARVRQVRVAPDEFTFSKDDWDSMEALLGNDEQDA